MAKGTISGQVKDKALGQAYLDAVLPLLPSGAVVRVTPKSIKVDMSRVKRYNKTNAETEGVSGSVDELPVS